MTRQITRRGLALIVPTLLATLSPGASAWAWDDPATVEVHDRHHLLFGESRLFMAPSCR
jgi:hypothetical protein